MSDWTDYLAREGLLARQPPIGVGAGGYTPAYAGTSPATIALATAAIDAAAKQRAAQAAQTSNMVNQVTTPTVQPMTPDQAAQLYAQRQANAARIVAQMNQYQPSPSFVAPYAGTPPGQLAALIQANQQRQNLRQYGTPAADRQAMQTAANAQYQTANQPVAPYAGTPPNQLAAATEATNRAQQQQQAAQSLNVLQGMAALGTNSAGGVQPLQPGQTPVTPSTSQDANAGTGAIGQAPPGETSQTIGSSDPIVSAVTEAVRFGKTLPDTVKNDIVSWADGAVSSIASIAKDAAGLGIETGATWANDFALAVTNAYHHPSAESFLAVLGAYFGPIVQYPQHRMDLWEAENAYQIASGKNQGGILGWLKTSIAQTISDPLGLLLTPFGADMYKWAEAPKNQAAITTVYEQGYTERDANGNVIRTIPPGKEAVLGLFYHDHNLLQNLLHGMGTDPLMLTLQPAEGIGAALRGVQAAEEASRAAEIGAALARTAGYGIGAAVKGIELPGDVLARGAESVFGQLKRIPGVQHAAEESPRSQANTYGAEAGQAGADFMRATQQRGMEYTPPQVPQEPMLPAEAGRPVPTTEARFPSQTPTTETMPVTPEGQGVASGDVYQTATTSEARVKSDQPLAIDAGTQSIPVTEMRKQSGRAVAEVGLDHTVRIREMPNGDWVVQTRDRAGQVWSTVETYGTRDAATAAAQDMVRRSPGYQETISTTKTTPETTVTTPEAGTTPEGTAPVPGTMSEPPAGPGEPIYPKGDWGFLDARNQKTDTGLMAHVQKDIAAVDPVATIQFNDRYFADPRTRAFLDEQRAFDVSKEKAAARSAGATGKALDTPQQVLSQIKHYVDVQAPIYRETIGSEPPPWNIRYGQELDPVAANPIRKGGRGGTSYTGTANINNLVEHAVFGTDAQAARAREYFHVQAGLKDIPTSRRTFFTDLLAQTKELRTEWQAAKVADPLPQAPRTAGSALLPGVDQTIAGTTNGQPPVAATARPGAPAEAPYVPPEWIRQSIQQFPDTYNQRVYNDLVETRPITKLSDQLNVTPRAPGETVTRPVYVDSQGRVTDPSPAGQYFNEGYITQQTYDFLRQEVTVNGQPMQAQDVLSQLMTKRVLAGETPAQVVSSPGVTLDEFRRVMVAATGHDVPLPMRGPIRRFFSQASASARHGSVFNPYTGIAGGFQDFLSNTMRAFYTGHGVALVDVFNPRNVWEMWKAQRTNGIPFDSLERDAEQLGIGAPTDTAQHSHRVVSEGIEGRSPLHKGMNKLLGSQNDRFNGIISGGTFGGSKTVRDFRAVIDDLFRRAVVKETLDQQTPLAREAFTTKAMQRATDAGIDPAPLQQAIEALPQKFAPADIRQQAIRVATDAGIDTTSVANFADRLGRDWTEQVGKMVEQAKAQRDQAFFSYKRTNADETLGQYIFFHYWMSRSLVSYADMALHNPALMAFWWRAWNQTHQKAKQDGAPNGILGMITFMRDNGFAYFLDPINVVVPWSMMANQNNTNLTWVDRISNYAYVNPIFQSALAVMGMSQNTPDPLASYGFRNFWGAVVNDMKAHGYLPNEHFGDAPFQQSLNRAYATANHFLASHGVPFVTPLGITDQSAYTKEQLGYQVRDEIVQATGVPYDQWAPDGPENQMWLAAKAAIDAGDATNPYVNQAEKDLADATLKGKVLRAVVPGGVRVRLQSRDQNRAAAAQALTMERANAANPHPGYDVQLPGNLASEQSFKTIAQGTSAADTLSNLYDQYNTQGPPDGKAWSDNWNQIVYLTNVPANSVMKVGNTSYTVADLQGMTEQDRKAIADQWVAENGGTNILQAYRDARTQFAADHPELQQYLDYRNTLYGQTSVAAARDAMAKGNPNFARAQVDQTNYLTSRGYSGQALSDQLDMWATSLDGYMAATGIKARLYGNEPIAVRDQSQIPYYGTDQTQGTATGTSSTPKSELTLLLDDLSQYQKDLVTYQDALKQAGINVPADQLNNPYLQPILNNMFGSVMPHVTQRMKDYLAWANAQPAGADTSPQAYERAMGNLTQAAA